MLSLLIKLTLLGIVPGWVLTIILTRDIVCLSGFVLLFMLTGDTPEVRPSIIGKLATFLQLTRSRGGAAHALALRSGAAIPDRSDLRRRGGRDRDRGRAVRRARSQLVSGETGMTASARRERPPLDARALARMARRAGKLCLASATDAGASRDAERLQKEVLAAIKEDVAYLAPQVGVIAKGTAVPRRAAWLLAVSPLDGADAFAAGIPTWAVSLGLVRADRPSAVRSSCRHWASSISRWPACSGATTSRS